MIGIFFIGFWVVYFGVSFLFFCSLILMNLVLFSSFFLVMNMCMWWGLGVVLVLKIFIIIGFVFY